MVFHIARSQQTGLAYKSGARPGHASTAGARVTAIERQTLDATIAGRTAKDIALDAGRLDFYGDAKFDGFLPRGSSPGCGDEGPPPAIVPAEAGNRRCVNVHAASQPRTAVQAEPIKPLGRPQPAPSRTTAQVPALQSAVLTNCVFKWRPLPHQVVRKPASHRDRPHRSPCWSFTCTTMSEGSRPATILSAITFGYQLGGAAMTRRSPTCRPSDAPDRGRHIQPFDLVVG